MQLERDIEGIDDAATNVLGLARACRPDLVRLETRNINTLILIFRDRMAVFGELSGGTVWTGRDAVFIPIMMEDVRDLLSGRVTSIIGPPDGERRGRSYILDINILMAGSERALNAAREGGVSTSDRYYTRLVEFRELAMRKWDALRESQEFRELSDMLADLERRKSRLADVRNRLQESFERSRSRAEGIMAKAEVILEACEGAEGGRKAQRPPKAEGPFDISGTWAEMKGGKPVREWEIKADKKGKITLIEPLQYTPGKVIEYSGSMEGTTLTVRHIIKDPALVDPKIPRKVVETAIQEYMPTWDLELKVSKEGTIEGKKTGFLVNYDPETLEVAWVKPRFERDIVLKKKGALAKGPIPAENCMESLRSFNREVQEYVREWQNFLDARDSLSVWRTNFDFAIRSATEELERARGEAEVDNPDSCEARKRGAMRHVNNASTVVARSDVNSTFAQILESHQDMSRRYNPLLGRRQEVEDCLRQLERTENPTDEQVELMGIARTNLDSLNYMRPPGLDWGSLDELRGDMRMRLSGLSGAISELDCRWRMFERINMKLRALGEEREILGMLLRGGQLSPEDLDRIRTHMQQPLPEELTTEEQGELRRRWESVYDNIRGRR
ncbi:MAG: hypothetical protein QMD05_09895 [Candidatus Brocadiaceae bacterium]|nr:hypothetical protein [Candidatus Brocadiaceae bacterium]